SDKTYASRHIPLYQYETVSEIQPKYAEIVCIELADNAQGLKTFRHPERAIYILGAEDYGLPQQLLDNHTVVQIDGAQYCLNVATAGSIVLYDRISKGT